MSAALGLPSLAVRTTLRNPGLFFSYGADERASERAIGIIFSTDRGACLLCYVRTIPLDWLVAYYTHDFWARCVRFQKALMGKGTGE